MGCPVRWSGVIVSGVVAAAVAVLMSDGETPTATQAAQSSPAGATVNPASCGPVALPKPGPGISQAKTRKALPIPAAYKDLYVRAAQDSGVPWQLLAAVGMIETEHGAMKRDSSAGAQGPMQFMPGTWDDYGVDGNGDGRKDVRDPADAIPAAAKYLVASGAKTDVRRALFAYNRASWYVEDVLTYAHAYGATNCDPVSSSSAAPAKLRDALAWANTKEGSPYVWGGVGPTSWDCSGLTQDTYRRAGITLPRTAEMQRSWLASGNGTKIEPGQERPGDLLFSGSPAYHVVMVNDTAKKLTIEARQTCRPGMKGAGIDCGVGRFDYQRRINKGAVIYRVNGTGE